MQNSLQCSIRVLLGLFFIEIYRNFFIVLFMDVILTCIMWVVLTVQARVLNLFCFSNDIEIKALYFAGV